MVDSEQTEQAMPKHEVPSDESILTRSGLELLVGRHLSDGKVEVTLRLSAGKKCVLHWGLSPGLAGPWRIPPEAEWPKDSKPAGRRAVQTPFEPKEESARIVIRMNRPSGPAVLAFVLFFPDENRWDNNRGRNYHIRLTGSEGSSVSPAEALQEETFQQEVLYDSVYSLDEHDWLAAAVCKANDRYRLKLITSLSTPLVLHWGVARGGRREWILPPPSMRPPGTVAFDQLAVQTPFAAPEGGLARLSLDLPAQHLPMGVCFVLKEIDTGRWLKDHGRDFYVPIDEPLYGDSVLGSPRLSALADPIISSEMSPNSWTLMHRFHLCHDLLDRVGGDVQGLALLFVWLRYSAIRQLDWQRNYNTKPRELSHSLDRLTQKLAGIYVREPAGRDLVRLMFTSVGRGGEGQRIRDEILEIMHRHHVKEVSGHFLEEWHQKLHNNTTPDDIVICEAYLEFLKSRGDLDAFYRTLQDGGVTRERLESYERPIRSTPDFVPHLREGLMHDFGRFLETLKAVHSGVDLETAVRSAGGLLDAGAKDLLQSVLRHRDETGFPASRLGKEILAVRRRVKGLLDQGREVRELLFLDLALESSLRAVLEKSSDPQMGRDDRVDLIDGSLENFVLSHDDPEIEMCRRHWTALSREPRSGKDWALQLAALADRLSRGLADFEEGIRDLLQPKAEFLGQAFRADSWAIELFSEEVVRGTLASVLSTMLHGLQPLLRRDADLGDWQIISPGRGGGRLEVVDTLARVQGKRFDRPVVVLAERISGYEEIPKQVTAILTPDGVDTLSHLGIRARNGRVLFAICYNADTIDRLRSLAGSSIRLRVSDGGDVITEEGEGEADKAPRPARTAPSMKVRSSFKGFALPLEEFDEESVGRKSLNLRRLVQELPEWISVPRFAAVPFGVFEKVRTEDQNQETARRYDGLTKQAEDGSQEALEELKRTVLALEAPPGFMEALYVVLGKAGVQYPWSEQAVWTSIKRVWASTWNARATLSRKAMGMEHGVLRMAVLIQEVVEAEYAFVIHTVNPLSGNREELYGEVVLGLGETLVSNYPGRALRMVVRKESGDPEIRAYPSKSFGLYGKGLICRSDSSGEDLAGYAGAGLYDSFTLEPPQRVRLDYTEERLLRDKGFLREFGGDLTRIGVTIENLFGTAQDIEGAYAKGRYYVVQTRPQVGFDDA